MTTKQKVHALLTDADRGYVSGEDLAGLCGVSRTAIWKAIASLREDGCVVDAVTNRGYRITSEPDVLDSEEIAKELKRLGTEPGVVCAFKTIDSTNTEAKRRAAEAGAFRGPDGTLTKAGALLHRALFASGEQTAGRGRMGRPFVSPSGTGVYFSLVFSPSRGVENPSLMTATAAVAVCRAVECCYGVPCEIKWVNDVFAGGKKICGILTEGISNFETGRIEAAIVGIGINIKEGSFPPKLARVAGSIEGACAAKNTAAARDGSNTDKSNTVTRNELVAHVVHELLAAYDAADKGDDGYSAVIAEYRKRSFLIGQTLFVNPAAGMSGTPYRAKVLDVDDGAGLVVQLENGTKRTLHSGEVSLHSEDFTSGAQ